MLKSSLLIFVIILFSSCAATNTITKLEHQDESIEIFMAKIPDKNFEEIGFIEVRGGLPMGTNTLMNTLVKRAKNDGANGLINVRMDSRGNMLHISGIAVKFEQDGLSEKIDLSRN